MYLAFLYHLWKPRLDFSHLTQSFLKLQQSYCKKSLENIKFRLQTNSRKEAKEAAANIWEACRSQSCSVNIVELFI